MSGDDVSAILRRLDDIDRSHGEIKDAIEKLQLWQTTADQAAHDRQVKLDTYRGIYRFAFRVWQSDAARWLAVPAGILVWNRLA